jgi:hypothetical protein
MEPEILREKITLERLKRHAELYQDMVKVVVDIGRGVLALGGEWHADDEALLLGDGSRQEDLWGANVYIGRPVNERIVYTSLINIRPKAGNRDMEIQDPQIREKVRAVIDKFIP